MFLCWVDHKGVTPDSLTLGFSGRFKTNATQSAPAFATTFPCALLIGCTPARHIEPRTPGRPETALYDVKTVIHRGLSREEIRPRFPAIRADAVDCRYVTYSDAIAILGRHVDQDALPQITWVLRGGGVRVPAAL